MIRALLIRRIFVLLDLALVATVLGTAFAVGLKLIEAPRVTKPIAADTLPPPEAPPAGVGERSAYEAIMANGLFGTAATVDVEEVVEVKEGPAPPTQLNLQLIGTSTFAKNDPAASAVILNLDAHDAGGSYWIGDTVIDDPKGTVVLLKVFPRKVILMNNQQNPPARETLSMDDPEMLALAAEMAPSDDQEGGDEAGAEKITINREEFVQDLYSNYAELVTSIRPEYYRDASGNVIGLTAQNISEVPMAQQLGLKDGDVLQSINNESIDSEQKVMELFQRYRDQSAFRIGILRNGRPKVITYRLE